jgi:polyphosphate kinase 2 (PPK2 family)
MIDLEKFRVYHGKRIILDDIDPGGTGKLDGSKSDDKDDIDNLTGQLHNLKERFHTAHKNALLIILQGMDTAGKDGTVKHVFESVTSQGVRLATFKAPTEQDLEHDFLWRIHQKTPAKGEIVIFNTFHGEELG